MTPPLGRGALILLLVLNGAMFLVEGIGGLMFDSMAVLADGLDMLADAAVYGIALYAIGRPLSAKIGAAFVAGYLQLALAVGALAELVRTVIMGSEPLPAAMLVLSVVALVVNIVALAVLYRHRHGEVHLRAAWIFSATDVQVNLAVIAAALLVRRTGSAIPDLVVAALIVGLVFRSVWRILANARRESAMLDAA